MKLKNRALLIIGGKSGIVLKLAKQLLKRGNTILVTGRRPPNKSDSDVMGAGQLRRSCP
jgi:short-subunit dehydrogenase involved in D-alanine esterification of teichoic acids